MAKQYVIFGAGPGGLYTAWRLLQSGHLSAGDTLRLHEWGTYDFDGTGATRPPAGRICSHHYAGEAGASYIEIGGMRYIEWDPQRGPAGHRLVTTAIREVDLEQDVIDFLTTDDPLFYLRGEHFRSSQLGTGKGHVEAPYDTPGNNVRPADDLYNQVSSLIEGDAPLSNRRAQCDFYATGTLPADFNSFVYSGGETASNVGYWNVFYDQAGNEGFNYAADAGGYSSNVINWNAANAAVYNGEFQPGGNFKTISGGYSRLFVGLYRKAVAKAADAGVDFSLHQGERLHSIWLEQGQIRYRLASALDPYAPTGAASTADVAFLAMPPRSVELVAQATRYDDAPGRQDFLNADRVANYLESVILQPSYKVAMFFDRCWWQESTYPPDLVSKGHAPNDVFGPTITDLPLRQIYYFRNSATPGQPGEPVYGLLASYDDMRFVNFWRELELAVDERRDQATSRDLQPLLGGGKAPPEMVRMLLLQLAKVHYGDPDAAGTIPEPLETVFMDWGLNPFGAGYHAWAAHYDICDVMQTVRAPGELAGVDGAPVYLVGSAFSNDQAWVEGAFCTAESVLVDKLGLEPLIDTSDYPLICGPR
ncbi:FAD-dependent oxidoreductase [Nocardioides sp. YIM 152588]|uniref:flavin monoamine oxidase family protein n=1 Tax=Nocardioides sp. YIM 152588 TaxID=3158259 RepID=UPI0032E3941F